jgi:hypothetical protein
MNFRSLTATAAMAIALTIAAQAHAAPCVAPSCTSFGLQTAEGGGSIASPDEVTVDLTNPTAATVTFSAPSGDLPTTVYLINVNGGFTAKIGNSNVSGLGSEDTFGQMSLITGQISGVTSFTIDLTAAGTNSWSSAANVLIPTCPNTEPTPSPGCGGFGVSGNSEGFAAATYHQGFEAAQGTPQAAGFIPVPAPLIGHGLPGILAIAGVLFGAGLVKRGKKRGPVGVPRAA